MDVGKELDDIRPGRKTYVYRFGGEGNDWCFVRTPDNYDPNREEPYPFIICNHGNGWEMDGSLKKANWTYWTMCISETSSLAQKNPQKYTLTEDETLWYSNPTIESFLKAGYIVCGAQNYGDLLYGNDDCRNACVDFFEHMVEKYNVTDSCFMLGASNGAQTTLNACYLLGKRVRAIILQYPLTSVVGDYFTNMKHQEGIRRAYKIKKTDVTKEELIKITDTHDVMYTDIENGRKTGYFPPTLIYYSKSDSVVDAKANAEALIDLLQKSGKVVKCVQIDSDGTKREHGDAKHFDPEEYVNWCEDFR